MKVEKNKRIRKGKQMGDWVINESSYKYVCTAAEKSRKEI